jgi:hypothetical protein
LLQRLAATPSQVDLPGGVYGLGTKRLHVLIDEQKPIDANALVDIVIAVKKGRVTEDELRVVVDALLQESCNTIECPTQEEAAEGSNYQPGCHRTFNLVVRHLLNCRRFMMKS